MLSLIALTVMAAPFTSQNVIYTVDGAKFEGYAALASGARSRPGILVVQDWNGVDAHEKSVCDKLAKLGYNAFAVDIYGQGNRPSGVQACSAESGKYYQDPELFIARMNAGLAQLEALSGTDAKRIAAIGYCFGGTGVLELARSGAALKGVVSFHGGLQPITKHPLSSFGGEFLVLHGDADPFVPKVQVDALLKESKAQKAKLTFKAYPNAVHAFTVPSMGFSVNGAAYDAKADQASWSDMRAFLKRIL